ncbi:class I SAM-dependent methyltransferase [Streptomyces sp. NPDC052114]|uniref:class I SAM-dependent methyltransferase n=1 Tax=unclassified Streptomyces TaxID=2593676 RepID=UPI003422EAE6
MQTKNAGGLAQQVRGVPVRGRHLVRQARETALRALAGLGLSQSESKISSDAQQYWARPGGRAWEKDSHWRAAPGFDSTDLWSRVGEPHLELFDKGARMVDFCRPWDRVVEWGCGGGANAVHFAPRAEEFVGVDISTETLDECAKQVAAVCATPFRPVRIDVAKPEAALRQINGPCDIFLCFYVFELIPTPEYGERVLRIAHSMLAPGGLALIQVKYDDGRWLTKSRRRFRPSALADLTTYPIASFWTLAARCGFTPEMIHLVPKNELDERYAYFLLGKAKAEATDAA